MNIEHGNRYFQYQREGIVTFIDVLGWKGIWRNSFESDTNDEPIEKLDSIIGSLQSMLMGFQFEDPLKTQMSKDTSILLISDTILIFTPVPSLIKSEIIIAANMHSSLCVSAIAQSIIKGIPFRGATSFGYCTIVRNTFIGPAIDEVASWYENADWIGVFMTPSLYLSISNATPELCDWVEYKPPIKNVNNSYLTYCVDWPSAWPESISLKETIKANNEGLLTPEISKKYLNTLDFYNSRSKKRE